MLETLKASEVIFKLVAQNKRDYVLDLSRVRKVSVLGVLVVYKIIEFSVEKQCFYNPLVYGNEFMEDTWDYYGFLPLMDAYVHSEETSSKMKRLNVKVTDKFILAPQPLLRNTDFTEQYLEKQFLPKIRQYYHNDEKKITMIFNCFSEILLNFWAHAVEDTKSIMIADGNEHRIEIACADTGNGIISTLTKTLGERFSKSEIIKKSVTKEVTSKKNSNHMGFGLWLIDEVATAVLGKFHLYSEGAYYQNENGQIKSGECSYWKGTIVYLSLPLKSPKTYHDIESLHSEGLNNIKVDFL